jgi:hypothetical protein
MREKYHLPKLPLAAKSYPRVKGDVGGCPIDEECKEEH